MDLFNGDLEPVKKKNLSDYIQSNDKKGTIDYLGRLTRRDFTKEVLSIGFSLISFSHGKWKVIEDVVRQINEKLVTTCNEPTA